MVMMKCYNCKHVWNYKGKSEHYVTCPQCLKKIKLDENRIDKEKTYSTQKGRVFDDNVPSSRKEGSNPQNSGNTEPNKKLGSE